MMPADHVLHRDACETPPSPNSCATTWTWKPCWTASLVPTSPSRHATVLYSPGGLSESCARYGQRLRPTHPTEAVAISRTELTEVDRSLHTCPDGGAGW